jgi:hypothetical protein
MLFDFHVISHFRKWRQLQYLRFFPTMTQKNCNNFLILNFVQKWFKTKAEGWLFSGYAYHEIGLYVFKEMILAI